MKKVGRSKREKVTPVIVKEAYTLGLGYNPADPQQSLETILGKHQAKYMNNIFKEMNKFTKTAVMTVIPDLFAQLLNVLKQEKQRLIAEALDAEATEDSGNDTETPVVEMKNPIKVPDPKAEDAPQDSEPEVLSAEDQVAAQEAPKKPRKKKE